jgi:hypothetical protein
MLKPQFIGLEIPEVKCYEAGPVQGRGFHIDTRDVYISKQKTIEARSAIFQNPVSSSSLGVL